MREKVMGMGDENSLDTTKILYMYLDISTSTRSLHQKNETSPLQLVLGTVSNRCVKKTVVRMTELVAALLTVHGSLSFLADVDHLLDPSGGVCLVPCRSPMHQPNLSHGFLVEHGR